MSVHPYLKWVITDHTFLAGYHSRGFIFNIFMHCHASLNLQMVCFICLSTYLCQSHRSTLHLLSWPLNGSWFVFFICLSTYLCPVSPVTQINSPPALHSPCSHLPFSASWSSEWFIICFFIFVYLLTCALSVQSHRSTLHPLCIAHAVIFPSLPHDHPVLCIATQLLVAVLICTFV